MVRDCLYVLAAFGKVGLYLALIVAATLVYGAIRADWSK